MKKFKVKRLDKNSILTVKVVLTNQLIVRLFIGVRLVKLAAWIMGCDVQVEQEEVKDNDEEHF